MQKLKGHSRRKMRKEMKVRYEETTPALGDAKTRLEVAFDILFGEVTQKQAVTAKTARHSNVEPTSNGGQGALTSDAGEILFK